MLRLAWNVSREKRVGRVFFVKSPIRAHALLLLCKDVGCFFIQCGKQTKDTKLMCSLCNDFDPSLYCGSGITRKSRNALQKTGAAWDLSAKKSQCEASWESCVHSLDPDGISKVRFVGKKIELYDCFIIVGLFRFFTKSLCFTPLPSGKVPCA